MARTFQILGRMTRRAVRSQAVQRAMVTASGYIVSELQTADIKLRLAYLRRKRADHLHLLGRTVYRLHLNGVEPSGNENIICIMDVLRGIDQEIGTVEGELAIRKEQQRREKEDKQSGSSTQSSASSGAERNNSNKSR